jgi:hypothetical protein
MHMYQTSSVFRHPARLIRSVCSSTIVARKMFVKKKMSGKENI